MKILWWSVRRNINIVSHRITNVDVEHYILITYNLSFIFMGYTIYNYTIYIFNKVCGYWFYLFHEGAVWTFLSIICEESYVKPRCILNYRCYQTSLASIKASTREEYENQWMLHAFYATSWCCSLISYEKIEKEEQSVGSWRLTYDYYEIHSGFSWEMFFVFTFVDYFAFDRQISISVNQFVLYGISNPSVMGWSDGNNKQHLTIQITHPNVNVHCAVGLPIEFEIFVA